MMEKKRLWIGMFLLVGLMLTSLVSAEYMASNPQFTQYTPSPSLFGSSLQFDESQCGQGQDFVIQVHPFGCEPAPVRSDLLEEQNVPVFCRLSATQMNPLIEVNAIESINFQGDYPEGIVGVGFQPARAALGVKNDLNAFPVLENIGYVVLVVDQYSNESEMPDSINGTLTAKIKYDVKNAFGISSSNYYLPVLSDADWEKRKAQYSFWDGKGYLRLETLSDDSATIGIYDVNSRLNSVTLKEGDTSGKISVPGFHCLGNLQLKLYDLSAPNTRARLIVNGDYVEVSAGEKFLEGRCYVESVINAGIVQKAQIKCREDDNGGSFETKTHLLQVSPKIKLNINDVEKEANVGDFLFPYSTARGTFYVYLGYAGTETGDARDMKIGLISLRESRDRLTDEEIAYVAKLNDAYDLKFSEYSGTFNALTFLADVLKEEWQFVSGAVSNIRKRVVEGSSVVFIDAAGAVNVWGVDDPGLSSPKEVYGSNTVSIEGFASAVDFVFDPSYSKASEAEQNYNLATENHDSIQETFSSEKTIIDADVSYGEYSLYNQIVLNYNLGQKKELVELCEDFKSSYSSSSYLNYVDDFCSDLKVANSEIASSLVFVNGRDMRITLEEVLEPGLDEFSAEVTIRGPNGRVEEVRLGQEGIYYLDDFRGAEDESLSGLNPTTKQADIYFEYDSELKKWTWRTTVNGDKVSVTQTAGAPAHHKDLIIALEKVGLEEGIRLILLDKSQVKGFEEFIQLVDMTETRAKFKIAVWDKTLREETRQFLVTNTYNLKLNEPYPIGGDYSFVLNRINLQRSARVGIEPNVDNVGSESNFSFGIEIEKRAIQLTPEKAESLIGSLNSTINKLESLNKGIGNTVKTLKGACYITGTVLAIKNFFANKGGRGIARKEVMTRTGGWNEFCKKEIAAGKYSTMTQCYNGNADAIEDSVDAYEEALKTQNEQIKRIQSSHETKAPFGEVVVNDKDFAEDFLDADYKIELEQNLRQKYGDTVTHKGTVIDVGAFVGNLTVEDVTIEELRDLQLNARLSSEGVLGDISENKLTAETYSIWQTIGSRGQLEAAKNTASLNIGKALEATVIPTKDTVVIEHKAQKYEKQASFGDIKNGDELQTVVYNGEKYYVKVDPVSGKTGEYTPSRVYDFDTGNLLDVKKDDTAKFLRNNLVIRKTDSTYYDNNGYVNPEVRYYQTEPYKGLPEMIPIDTKNGWYVATRQTLPIGGQLKAYDDSGRVTSFYIGNVGANGIEEFLASGDDDWQLYNAATGTVQFTGLTESETMALVKKARAAIEDASRGYSANKRNVNILGTAISVGAPAANIPSMTCQEIMSTEDCMLLFNICDPVMCPSSRCNYGGNYRVADVVQTGIVGGLALCAHNSREGIVLPVCLSAINAGLENLVTVKKSYRDCLQESLESGRTVGVCDEMHSIYLCELLWREGIQLSRLLDVPSLVGIFTGRGSVRGGGEYLTMQSAFNNLENSVSYFTNFYAVNAVNAFRARTASEIGGEVCKNFASLTVPGVDIFDALTDPDSPSQFNGRFDEIPFTDTTVPPISHYKVYYHIYSGQDSSAYYKVYLKGTAGLYQDTSIPRIVDQGYLNKGDFVSETKDFTAPAGYNQMCIVVNEQEECGFQEVSTSFTQDFIRDKYIEDQASRTGITTSAECVSGSASVYSLINPNLQEGFANYLRNPEVYNSGLVRTCGTENPAQATDLLVGTNQSRWIEVGYCDVPENKCWLDTSRIDDLSQFEDIEDRVLSDIQENVSALLDESGSVITPEQFSSKRDEIFWEVDVEKKLAMINDLYNKVTWNNQRAELLLIRAQTYEQVAKLAYDEYVKILNEERERELEEKFGIVEERKDIEYLFKTRTLQDVQNAINYAKENSIGDRTCKCGDNCGDYAKYIYDASREYGIPDPILLLSIMLQESNCVQDTTSTANAVGLMQIVSWDLCKSELNLKVFNDLKGQENAENNVDCGAIILKKKYDAYNKGRVFTCDKTRVRYYEWEAAVRGYVGWGCDKFHKTYTEDVMQRYRDLVTYLDGMDPLKGPGFIEPEEGEAALPERPYYVRVRMELGGIGIKTPQFSYDRDNNVWTYYSSDNAQGGRVTSEHCGSFAYAPDICEQLAKLDELGGYNYLNSLDSSKYTVTQSFTRFEVGRQKLVEEGQLPEEPVIVRLKLATSGRHMTFRYDISDRVWEYNDYDPEDSVWISTQNGIDFTFGLGYGDYKEHISKLALTTEREGYEYFQELLSQGPSVVEKCENCAIPLQLQRTNQ